MNRIALFCSAVLLSCAQAKPLPQAAEGPVRVDGPAARKLVAGGATLVDVRAPSFYAGGHIDGAVNIPAGEIEARAAEIPRDRPVVLYCLTGANSAKSAAKLAALGYRQVYDLGAYTNWGEGAPAPAATPGTCPQNR